MALRSGKLDLLLLISLFQDLGRAQGVGGRSFFHYHKPTILSVHEKIANLQPSIFACILAHNIWCNKKFYAVQIYATDTCLT